MRDFLAFRRMMTPFILQLLFWLGVVFCVVMGVVELTGVAEAPVNRNQALLVLIVGPLALRVFFELVILFFQMNETLTDIRTNTKTQSNNH